MHLSKLSIIIPVFNEVKTVGLILEKIKLTTLINAIEKELIIIDDGSHDNSKKVIFNFIKENPDLDIKLYEHKKNIGKGGAIQTGISLATGEYLIIQDADLEYNPEEYNLLLTPVIQGNIDVVYGSRFLDKKPNGALYFWHYTGNKFLTFFSNIFSSLNLTDMETCYKMFNTKLIQSIKLTEKRFGFEPEITAKISRIKNISICEVSISYYGRRYNEGKKIGWKDGVRALFCIIKYGLFKMD